MSATRDSLRNLRKRRIPAWWQDAKLGIFVHWTPAAVPAFAPVDDEIGDLLQSDRVNPLQYVPYTEWYENSLRFPNSPVSRHHRQTYGDRPYTEFARDWEAGLEHWDPAEWAAQFRNTGARYVVLVAKHSDGYCLWPTSHPNPIRPNWHCERDVVGELAEAVRSAGMRFGLYYSGGFDWSFDSTPVGTMGDVANSVPQGEYPAYADAQVRELIDRYQPSVLWNDIAWPGDRAHLWQLLEHYYRVVPDGVINDRWIPWSPLMGLTKFAGIRRLIESGSRKQARKDGGLIPPKPPFCDYRTPEYVVFDQIQSKPWELVRGMDRSFGHNEQSKPEHFVTEDELLWQFTDVVAKGGNLLLNVGPRGVDAQIPPLQSERLSWLGEYVSAQKSALIGTRPWILAASMTPEGFEVRYTSAGSTVYALVRGVTTAGPPANESSATITLAEVQATPGTRVELLNGNVVSWTDAPDGLRLEIPDTLSPDQPLALALHNVQARGSQD